MSNSYAEAKNRAKGPGRWAKVAFEHDEPKLKKDWVLLINEILPTPVEGLEKLTVASLRQLKRSLLL